MGRGRGPGYYDEGGVWVSTRGLERAVRQSQRGRGDHTGGRTSTATSFRSAPNRDDPSKVNHYFNTPGDGDAHGHVQEIRQPDGGVQYTFARDAEGDVYDV